MLDEPALMIRSGSRTAANPHAQDVPFARTS
jgi:hypothetical protein